MSDYPDPSASPLFIHPFSAWSCIQASARTSAVATPPASMTWPVANTAFYIPFFLPWPYPVNRVFWVNGTSVTSTNRDFGIYTSDGTKIYSTGSTAAAGASVPQYVTPTPFVLAPGAYYFAMTCSSVTANRGGEGSTAGTLVHLRYQGLLQEASALPLPATLTPVALANVCVPMCGITRTASGF